MEFVDRESTPVYEEKTSDETTCFISENGSSSKKRRRKSLGRRVSFAEAPKLHIFPRDDEYETPTRGTTDAAVGSPSSGGRRRSPRIAMRVVDADKENRVLDFNPDLHRGRRRRAGKPLAARGEESPALKPQNWLDERDSSAQAGNDEENTGPVDLRHLSFHAKESEMDEENLTLDSTTFALKFSLHRGQNGELAVVQPDQITSAAPIVQAFPDDEEVLEKDMSFTISRKPLRKRSLSQSHEGVVGEMTRDMSLTEQAPLALRMASVNRSDETIPATGKSSLDDNLALVIYSNNAENRPVSSDVRILTTGKSSLPRSKDDSSALVIYSNNEENSLVSSDQRIPATGKSSLRGSKDDNSAPVYSNNAKNGSFPVVLAVDVLAQIENRFGTGSVVNDDDDEINPNFGRAALEAAFGPGFVHDEIDHSVPATRNTALPSSRDGKSSTSVINSRDVENSPLPVSNSVNLRDQLQARSGTGFVDDQLNVTTGREKNLEATSPVGVSVTSLSLLSVGHEDGTKTMGTPSLRHLVRDEEDENMSITGGSFDATPKSKETLDPTEDAEMMLTKAEFTGIDSLPKEVDVRSTDRSFSELQRGREMINLVEEAEISEAEFTGIDISPKDAHVRATDMDLKGARETLNPTEAEFPGVDCTSKELNLESIDRSFSELQRGSEMVHPAEEAELMLKEAEFTGADSPPKGVDLKSTVLSFPELQRRREVQSSKETLDTAEEAQLVLREAEFTGTDSPPLTVDVRSPDMGPPELQRVREILNPIQEAELMLTEAEFTGKDSPRKNVDVRSPDMGSPESQRAREILDPIQEAELMLTEAEFTGKDSPQKKVDVMSPGMGSTELRRARDVQGARETFNPMEEAELMLTEAEFTAIDSPPKNVDVRSSDVGFTELQRVRETQSPALDTKMGTGKYTVREPHYPEFELNSTKEVCGRPEQAESNVKEIEIQKGSETIKLHMDGDVTVTHAGHREREKQEIKDTPSSPEIGCILTKDLLSTRRMQGGEEFHNSNSVDDAELCLKNESKEMPSSLRDAHLVTGALEKKITALQRSQQFGSQVTPGKRMPVAAFQQPVILESPATTNISESSGPHFDNRSIKRTKVLRDMSSGDTNQFSPTLERVTAQVPRLSDLLAADMDSGHSTPVRPMRRSMWMTPPTLVTASRSKVLEVSSPTDFSMEIVELTTDPTRHSFQSRIQAVEEVPETSGQAPEKVFGRKADGVPILALGKNGVEPDTRTRERMDPVYIPKTFQKKENTGMSQRAPLQVLKTTGRSSEQERPALREITDPAQILGSSRGNGWESDTRDKRQAMDPPHGILKTSCEENRHSTITSPGERALGSKTHDNDCIQDTAGRRDSTADRTYIFSAPQQEDVKLDSLPNWRQSVPLEVTENQQRSLAPNKVVDPSQILSVLQPEDREEGILMNRSLGVESREKGDGRDHNPFVKEAVDSSRVTRNSMEEEQCPPSGPRPTGSSAQLIRAADRDKLYEMNSFHKPESVPKLSDDKPAGIIKEVRIQEVGGPLNGPKLSDDKPSLVEEVRTQEVGGGSISIPRMSVEEFLQLTKVQFSHGLRSFTDLLNDPSLDETYHVRSLSECFTFLCLVQPQLQVLTEACEGLYGNVGNFTTAIEEIEDRLTAHNPAIFSYFQNAPEWDKQHLRKQIERIQENYKLSAQKNLIRFRQGVERDYSRGFLVSKESMTYYVSCVREKRNVFADKCQRPFRLLQANLFSRNANEECTSTPTPQLPNADVHLRTLCLEKIEALKQERKDLESSTESKLAKLSAKKQAAEDKWGGLKEGLQLKKKNLADLRSQVVDKVCSGKSNLRREEVAESPHLYVQKMRDEVCFLHRLQDGFQLKSNGTENHDPVLELSYRSLLKRRYVVRKVGTTVKVLRSSWALVPEKIEEMFPRVNAILVFSLAFTTTEADSKSKETATKSRSSTQIFGRLSALEAVRFVLPILESGGIPEPTSLRASMQVTRILVGNLVELMEDVGKCQPLVNTSCGGGVLAEPLFRNAPDGKLQLQLEFIDCVSSIKFFVNLDISCVPLNGYQLGDLRAKVEIAYCAPKALPRFKRESLEDLLSRVEPGYRRLLRTFSAVGAFLGSIRRGE